MSVEDLLPRGWARVRLSDIAQVRSGNTPKGIEQKIRSDGQIPWFKVGDMNRDGNDKEMRHGKEWLTPEDAAGLRMHIFPPGAIVFPKRGGAIATNKKRLLCVPSCLDLNTMAVIPLAELTPFVWWWFIALNLATLSDGSNVPQINHSDIEPLTLPIAPLAEQVRIVAQLEELLSDLDAGVAALKRAKANLKRYRAAVLKAAVEGKLTEEWRAKHPNTEPASKLLARILTERRQKWEAAQLVKFAAVGKEPLKSWRDKYVEPPPPDTTGVPLVPESWTWATLEAITYLTGGITKDQKKANQPGMREVPYLRVANVQRGLLDLSEMKSISASEADIAELRLEPGDVLFTEGGDRDKLGRGWVWFGELAECIHQNHIFRGRPVSQEIQPEFISHHGNTFGKEWFIKSGKQTTNLASINLGVLRRFPVPVPPADEQAEIISLVDERLSVINAAETEIAHSMLRAARLRRSILKQAFEGKLVPQDPLDTPAILLLERLREARSTHEVNIKGATPTFDRQARSRQVENIVTE